MRFAIVVTGPAHGTQQMSSAFQFVQALITESHELSSVFFYWGGVYDANQLTSPASDELDLVRGWQQLSAQHGVVLNIYVAAALHRGAVDETKTGRLGPASSNPQPRFTLNGPGAPAKASLICDRVVRF